MGMSRFSASEAALEGFRLTRERPGTIFGWGVVYTVCMFVIGQLMLFSLDPQLVEFTRKHEFSAEDYKQIEGLLAQSWPAMLLVMVLVAGLFSTLMGGIYRLVLRPQERGFLHLRFGADELRLTVLNLLLVAVGVLCLTAEIAALKVAQDQGAVGALVAGVLLALTVWLGVRLSLATPMTFDLRRFALREAWAASRGRFWPLLGMIILAGIFYVMVWLLISVIGVALLAVAGGADVSHMRNFTGPAIIGMGLYLFLQLVLQVIELVMIYAPFAVAYQQVHDHPPVNPLRVSPQDS
jgi:uncharacterized membrane protein